VIYGVVKDRKGLNGDSLVCISQGGASQRIRVHSIGDRCSCNFLYFYTAVSIFWTPAYSCSLDFVAKPAEGNFALDGAPPPYLSMIEDPQVHVRAVSQFGGLIIRIGVGRSAIVIAGAPTPRLFRRFS
jgi:hypothetical protein